MNREELQALLDNVREEIRIFERPSVDNSKEMLELLTDIVANRQSFLPPAEGAVPGNAAEQNKRMREWFKERTGLDDTLLSIHMKQIDVMLKGVQPQPTAEGAEAIVKKYEDEYDFKFHWVQRDRVIRMMREFAAQPQPTAEGAEEILRKNCNTCYSRSTGEEEVWSSVSSVLIAMQEFATLHAQKLADKMVSERMEQYKAQFKDRPNPLEVNPYDSKGIKRIRNRKIH